MVQDPNKEDREFFLDVSLLVLFGVGFLFVVTAETVRGNLTFEDYMAMASSALLGSLIGRTRRRR